MEVPLGQRADRAKSAVRVQSGEQRLLVAYEMSLFARELSRERIRHEHPEWPETRIARELLRLAFLPAPLPACLNELS